MEVLFVLPDYYSEFPKACMDGWGRRFILVSPDGLVLPCHVAHTLPGVAVGERARSLARRDLEPVSPASRSTAARSG